MAADAPALARAGGLGLTVVFISHLGCAGYVAGFTAEGKAIHEIHLHPPRHRAAHCRRSVFHAAGRPLPSFFPGHEAGVMRLHVKHGIVAGAAGAVLLMAGWFMGRR